MLGRYEHTDGKAKLVLTPNEYQKSLLSRSTRYTIFVAGRRSGKSEGVCWHIFFEALKHPNSDIAYIAPTYGQAKDIMFTRLRKVVPKEYVQSVYASSPPKIKFKNGCTVHIYGAHNAESIRGMGFVLAIFDESADIKEEVWTEIIQPTLAQTRGSAIFIGTPKGKANWFYELWLTAHKDADWTRIKCTTLEAGTVHPEEIERARRTLDERTFRQEYEASFESLGSVVYYAFNESCVVEEVPLNYGRGLVMAWDFNSGEKPMAVCILQEQNDGIYTVVKDFQYKYTNTFEMCESIGQWLDKDGTYSQGITVVGDYSGRRRTSQSSRSDYAIIAEAFKNRGGAYKEKMRPTLHIRDRVSALNSLFGTYADSTQSSKRLRVGKNCVSLIQDLERTQWKDNGSGLDDRVNERTHISDALSYFAYNFYPVDARGAKTLLQ